MQSFILQTSSRKRFSAGLPTRFLGICILILLFGPSLRLPAQTSATIPTKIEVVTDSNALPEGQDATVRVSLLDPENRPVTANKDFAVEVESRTQSGATTKSSIVVKAGTTTDVVKLPLKETGIVMISASNRELATGGTVIHVAPQNRTAASPPPADFAPVPQPSASISASPKAGAAVSPRVPMLARGAEMHSKRRSFASRSAPETTSPTSGSASRSAQPRAVAAAPADAWLPTLNFIYYPNRKLSADEKDSATVYAYLSQNDIAHWDMPIYLMSDIGPLNPEVVTIRKGQKFGKATLVADRPAKVTVQYLSSEPWAQVSGVPLAIHFGPPITGLRIVPNPPLVGLFDTAEINVELINPKGISVTTDESRTIYVSIGSGRGEFDKTQLDIGQNSSRIATRFIPTWPGMVTLTASSPSLQDVSVQVRVVTPLLLLILCGIGGAIGGAVAFWADKAKDANFVRVLIGIVTGFVLYWALLFGVLHIPHFSHAFLLNPFSAVILPFFGGWGGTKVITLILKQFGWAL